MMGFLIELNGIFFYLISNPKARYDAPGSAFTLAIVFLY